MSSGETLRSLIVPQVLRGLRLVAAATREPSLPGLMWRR
jgi:hypothetical protein